MNKLPATTILLCAAIGTVHAQDAVFVDIAPCMALAVDTDRHDCYDRLEAAVRAAQQLPAPPVATAPTPVAPAAEAPLTASVPASLPAQASPAPVVEVAEPPAVADAVATFGKQTPVEARVEANESGDQELLDTITGLRQREPGRWLITLASGQIWYQTNSSRIRLREGMAVRIYPSPLGGSFRLAGTDGNSTGFVQVTRVE